MTSEIGSIEEGGLKLQDAADHILERLPALRSDDSAGFFGLTCSSEEVHLDGAGDARAERLGL